MNFNANFQTSPESAQSGWSDWVRFWTTRAVGVLLAISGTLKLAGFGFHTVGALSVLTNPALQLFVIEVELVLACWLWSGTRCTEAWVTAIFLFTVFALVSFYQGVIGVASCGCFGAVHLSPWQALGIDILMLSILGVFRPQLATFSLGTMTRLLKFVGSCVAALLLILGVIVLGGQIFFGSPQKALAALRGDTLTLWPQPLDLGTGDLGEVRAGAIELTNWGPETITIVGGTLDCSCAATKDLPAIVPSGQTVTLTVVVGYPRKPGSFSREAWFYIQRDMLEKIPFRISGRVR